MTSGQTSKSHDPRIAAAVAELEELVRSHYPSATFQVAVGVDESDAVHIVTTVDVDDPDEVADLVVERELALQVDEGLPVYVIPVRTAERVAALPQQHRYEKRPIAPRPTSASHS
jgi:hypothetical protein